jgi:hypothetical protein
MPFLAVGFHQALLSTPLRITDSTRDYSLADRLPMLESRPFQVCRHPVSPDITRSADQAISTCFSPVEKGG